MSNLQMNSQGELLIVLVFRSRFFPMLLNDGVHVSS